MPENDLIEKFYTLAVQERLWSNKFKLRFHLKMIFEGVTLKNKCMLDIGGGNGICTFYAACKGAEEAICLEPEVEGVIAGSVASFHRLQAHGLSGPCPAQAYQRAALYCVHGQ